MGEFINNWNALASLLEELSDAQWIFRGEDQEQYGLQPKAGRIGSERNSRKKPYAVDDETKALELFKRQARPYIGHTPSSDLEWLAIAQHHGMSTRLLDWSESLLVAAYFATEKAGTCGNGVIYGVCDLKVLTEAEAQVPFNLHDVGLYRPPHIAPRIPAQRSVFTVHPNPTALFTSPSLCKWIISASACITIKRILDASAINESSLFPDLDGLSRYIGWRYKWGKF